MEKLIEELVRAGFEVSFRPNQRRDVSGVKLTVQEARNGNINGCNGHIDLRDFRPFEAQAADLLQQAKVLLAE